jgi:WD40 repeat protein
VSQAGRAWRWARRNPALAAAAGLAAAPAIALVGLSIGFGVYQGRAADDLRREQKQTEAAKDRAVAAEGKAQGLVHNLQEADRQKALLARQSARLVLDQGQRRCEQGDVAVGLLSLAHGLEIVPDDAPELAAVIRMDLDVWRGRLRPLRAVLDHPDLVSENLPFSPDGKRLLTTCNDGTARLWDVATGRQVGLMRFVPSGLPGAFSPDGLKVMTPGPDKTAVFWDAATGQQVGAPFHHPRGVYGAALSPDGKTIATTGQDNTVRLWNMKTGEPIGRPIATDGGAPSVAFSSNGKTLLTYGAETARLWNVDTGESVGRPMTIDRDPMHHKGTLWGASFSPDGKTILTYSRDGTVRLWDAATQKERSGSPLWRGELVRAKFSPDGARILTTSCQHGSDNTARLSDSSTGRLIGRPMPHLAEIASTAFSPDSKLVLTGSNDRTAQLWNAATGPPGVAAFAPGRRWGGRLQPGRKDGRHDMLRPHGPALGRDDGRPRSSGPASRRRGCSHCLPARRQDDRDGMLGREGPALGCEDATAHRRSLASQAAGLRSQVQSRRQDAADRKLGQDRPALGCGYWRPREAGVRPRAPIFGAAFSTDSERIATTGNDYKVRLWRATGDLLHTLRHDKNEVYCASFSPDGRYLITGGYDTARLWDAKSGQLRGKLAPPFPTWSLAFSPDGKTLISGCLDLRARFWDVDTGRLHTVSLPHRDWVMAVRYSRDGRMVLTAGRDGTARL